MRLWVIVVAILLLLAFCHVGFAVFFRIPGWISKIIGLLIVGMIIGYELSRNSVR